MKRTRTFLAIDIGHALRSSLSRLMEGLEQTVEGVKWVTPENLHVTLLFLGEVDQRDLLGVCRAADRVASEQAEFTLSVEGLGCFPNERRPRVLWAGIAKGAEEIVGLHDALEIPLLDLGCYRREARKYSPHLTLGRLAGEDASAGLTTELRQKKAWSAGQTTVKELHVMASVLTPSGPEYTVLSRAKFGG